MQRYFIRALKFSIYFLSLLLVILTLIYIVSAKGISDDASIWRFFKEGRPLIMIFIALVFGAIYPFIGFATVKIYLNKPLGDDKQTIIEMFAKCKYVVEKDKNNILMLRPKSKLKKLTRMNEDALELDYSKFLSAKGEKEKSNEYLQLSIAKKEPEAMKIV